MRNKAIGGLENTINPLICELGMDFAKKGIREEARGVNPLTPRGLCVRFRRSLISPPALIAYSVDYDNPLGQERFDFNGSNSSGKGQGLYDGF